MANIALLGSTDRAGLALCRSLSKAGHEVSIFRFRAARTPADVSRHCAKAVFVGNPAVALDPTLQRILDELPGFDYLIPITDSAMAIVDWARPRFDAITTVVGPAPDAYRLARNKHDAIIILAEIGLRAPRSILITRREDALQVEFPCFAKPVQSALVHEGRLQTFSVARLANAAQLDRKLRDDLQQPLLVQEVLTGNGVGLNFCALNGRLLGASVTERVHEPGLGGGSSYRRIGELTPEILSLMVALARRLEWTGFMMIECKRHEGELYLMELNCRPWGSIDLSIQSGVDFPRLMIDALKGKEAVVVTPTRDVYSRHLKKDLGWLLQNPRQLLPWLGSLSRLISGRETLDVERLEDWKPGAFQLVEFGRSVAERLARRLPTRLAQRQVRRSDPLIAVCKGNINRSVVAEAAFRHFGFHNVQSASLLARRGRRPSAQAEKFAKAEFGIDVSGHVSTMLEDVVQPDSIIVVCELRHAREILERIPSARGRIVHIAKLGDSAGDVSDPDGRSDEDYLATFRRITSLVKRAAHG